MAAATKQDELRLRRLDSDDRRVLKTRERLVEAYRALLDEDPDAAIGVTAVVARAGVTRSSFYAHFTGVSDLAAVALSELTAVVVRLARTATRAGESKDAVNERALLAVATFLSEHRRTYGALFTSGGEFTRAVETALAEESLTTLRARKHPHADPEITARYTAAGTMAILTWWLGSDGGRSPEALAHELMRVAPPDFRD
jgi:AcrR family transcriptional regulator